MRVISILVGLSFSVLGVACASYEPREGVVEGVHDSKVDLASKGHFVDRDGRTWVNQGQVSYSELTVEGAHPNVTFEADRQSIDILDLTLEEAAAMLAPRTEFGGVEWQLSSADKIEFARHVQNTAREHRAADSRGESGAPGAYPSFDEQADDGNEEIASSSQALVVMGESRVSIDGLNGTYPYNLHGRYGNRCTCYKMINNHTCITSAHCLYDTSGWKTRQNIYFGGSVAPLPSVPSNCYARTVASGYDGTINPDLDYGVIALRGFHGAWCDLNSYNVGNFGWNTVANNETGIATHLSGYPGEGLPYGWTYPTLSYEYRTDTFQSMSSGYVNLLRYYLDSTGGQSGTAVWKTFGSGDYRVLATNFGGVGTINAGPRMFTSNVTWMAGSAGY